MENNDITSLMPIIGLSTITASLCCLPSVIWVLFAGSSAIVAANTLSETLYYSPFRYFLYLISFIMISLALITYFRKRGICTLDDAKKNQRRIINTSLAVFAITIISFLIWNYVILEIIGIAIGLPWEESAFWN